jgi:ABC-type polysaccharide/polyol phosphate transport system ATPase subunit
VARDRSLPIEAQSLWALNEVSFGVEKGQALGIIGPNGAGKTTCLKLISSIIRPTSGKVAVAGRVSALIELGAGFHPDLTGRENIYLNGVILGMTRREIEMRFDAIVAFSGLQRFLDTPVKRYSSGMYCRLGFSVAAHVDPDILVTDEVLAVGDQGFQSKCYQRIAELKKAGTTIVLVTHALTLVRRVCDRAILLHRGRLIQDGDPASVVAAYLDKPEYTSSLQETVAAGPGVPADTPPGNAPVKIVNVAVLTSDGRRARSLRTGEPFAVRVEYDARERVVEPSVTVKLLGLDGTQYAGYNSGWDGVSPGAVEGTGHVRLSFEALGLLPGEYALDVRISDHQDLRFYDWRAKVCRFRVVGGPPTHSGLLFMPHGWQWESGCEALTHAE